MHGVDLAILIPVIISMSGSGIVMAPAAVLLASLIDSAAAPGIRMPGM